MPFGYGIQADPRGSTSANIGHLKALGFNWVKFQMPWKDVEPSPGGYSWGMWDQLIDAYAGYGINVMLSIPKAPNWARPPDDDKSVEGPPADPQEFADFLGAMASRYKGKVGAYEVWNEQNLHYEWGNEQLDPAHERQRRIDPPAVVRDDEGLDPVGHEQLADDFGVGSFRIRFGLCKKQARCRCGCGAQETSPINLSHWFLPTEVL